MKSLFFIISFFYFFSPNYSFAQCCSAGNPVGGEGSIEGLNKKELKIFSSYKHSLSEDYYHFDAKYNIPYIDKSYYDFVNTSFTYGILPKFAVHAEIGYFIDKIQELNLNNEKTIIKSHGLGDLGIQARYTVLKTVKPISQLVLSMGAKIPIGDFNEELNGITIPLSLQPSSGALKYNMAVFYSRNRIERKFGWHTYSMFEMSNTINQGFLVYKYGNYFQFSLAGNYKPIKNLLLIGNLKFEWRDLDTRESGIKVESSGSRVVYFNPQIIYTIKSTWNFILLADIPLYKYVNGYQPTNKFSFQVGVSKSFSLCKTDN